MYSRQASFPADRLVSIGGFFLAVALYLPYFFLPVADFNGPILGWEGFILSVMFPPMWPIALGHFALWVGAICLLLRRWRSAWIAGVAAIVISFESWGIMLDTPGNFPGLHVKLASMITVVAGGLVGAICLRQR